MTSAAFALQIPSTWQAISGSIQLAEGLIADLAWDWRVALILTLLVILGGTVSTAIQFARNESHKVIVGVCGAMTAALATINGLVYPLSAKEMGERINKAESEIHRALRYMEMHELPLAGAERIAQLEKVNRYLENVEVIISGAASTSATQVTKSWLTRSALADGGPTWSENFSKQDGYLYFVGTGVGDSLEAARSDSISFAKQEAQRAILDQLPAAEDSSKIAQILGSEGSVADTDFRSSEKDGRKIFTYSTLYAIKRRNIEFYLASSGVNLDAALGSVQKNATYYRQRWEAYAAALDLARTRLSDTEYKVLLAGRNGRREKEYGECTRMLSAVVKPDDPAWYLGWLNLGLCYWNLHEPEQAGKAFAEATKLEPKLTVRDPSLYNTYGQFLVEREKYGEGEKLLRKALEMNPDIAGARYAINVAQRQMGGGTQKAMAAEAAP